MFLSNRCSLMPPCRSSVQNTVLSSTSLCLRRILLGSVAGIKQESTPWRVPSSVPEEARLTGVFDHEFLGIRAHVPYQISKHGILWEGRRRRDSYTSLYDPGAMVVGNNSSQDKCRQPAVSWRLIVAFISSTFSPTEAACACLHTCAPGDPQH